MTNQEIIEKVVSLLSLPQYKKGLSMQSIWSELFSDELFISEKVTERNFRTVVTRECRADNGELQKSSQKEKGTGRALIKVRSKGPKISRTVGVPEGEVKDSATVGAAGEMAVLSELTFRGFNATKMPVDKGIDVVAEKENKFYYYQVKTAHLKDNGVAHFEISRESFERVHTYNVYYVLLVRTPDRKMVFLVLTQAKIEELRHNQLIEYSTGNVNINIHYDSVPLIVRNNKQEDLSFYLNRFE